MSPNPNRCPQCTREWNKGEKGRRRKRTFKERHPGYYNEWAKAKGGPHRKKWKARNKHKVNSYTRVRQARIKTSTVEFVDYAVVIQRANGVCGICRQPFGVGKIEIDHVIPLSKGGGHTYENVQAAHAECNRRKGVRIINETT